ncbi:hypothetical protein INR49_014801 [Caranx melampygus]|nr:hypothetical protein INR49_014801 [Caranx melampygus]
MVFLLTACSRSLENNFYLPPHFLSFLFSPLTSTPNSPDPPFSSPLSFDLFSFFSAPPPSLSASLTLTHTHFLALTLPVLVIGSRMMNSPRTK